MEKPELMCVRKMPMRVCVCVRSCEYEVRSKKEERSQVTIKSAHNLRPQIPYGDLRRYHDAYEVHAATS